MPSVFGIPLIGFIQMVLGTAIIVFLAIKFLKRPKKNKKGEYIIKDVHIIVGNGDEASHQYVYIKGGKIEEISDIPAGTYRQPHSYSGRLQLPQRGGKRRVPQRKDAADLQGERSPLRYHDDQGS